MGLIGCGLRLRGGGGRQGVARLAIHVGLRGECRVGRN